MEQLSVTGWVRHDPISWGSHDVPGPWPWKCAALLPCSGTMTEWQPPLWPLWMYDWLHLCRVDTFGGLYQSSGGGGRLGKGVLLPALRYRTPQWLWPQGPSVSPAGPSLALLCDLRLFLPDCASPSLLFSTGVGPASPSVSPHLLQLPALTPSWACPWQLLYVQSWCFSVDRSPRTCL